MFKLVRALVGLALCAACSARPDGGSSSSSSSSSGNAGSAVPSSGMVTGFSGSRAQSSSEAESSSIIPQVRPPNSTCTAPARPSTDGTVALRRVFEGLSFDQPTTLTQAPGDRTAFYVTERGGKVYRFENRDDVTEATEVLSIDVNTLDPETGLLGLAFHPAWQQTHDVYIFYSAQEGPTNLVSHLSRFHSDDNGLTFNPASEEILLFIPKNDGNHNGGHILFGPDGYLYIAVGDGGSAGDPHNHAQDLDSLLGKMLRIDVDHGDPYAIPSSNPFQGAGQKPEIYAYGLRNPWRWSFDRDLGTLWAGDVGQDTWEEIDVVTRGGNYGWRLREAMHCFNPRNNCPTENLIEPIWEYPHSTGRSVTGGYVYRGARIPALFGTYLFADFQDGRVFGAYVDGETPAAPRELMEIGFNIASFAEDLDGELYVLDYGAGAIRKFFPGDMQPTDTFPKLLSQTGCVDGNDATQPAAGLIPYDVIDAFWSDGAVKTRFLALPDATTIEVGDDGDFHFPIGTVLVKTFKLMNRLVETRLFMRHPDGTWGGYSYEWNDAQTDATLLTGQKEKDVNGQRWIFPSGAQCMECHNAATGNAIGLEVAQLNRDFVYPNGSRENQLQAFTEMGLFSTPPGGAPATLDALAPLDSMAPVDERARSYLHTNCAYCHRPNGSGRGPADLRYTTAPADMHVCNADPQEGNLDVTGAKLLVPGDSAHSLVYLRMSRRGVAQMPPLASSEVDPEGAALIDAWITGQSVCP